MMTSERGANVYPLPRFGIVAVAASLGSLNALTRVLSALPAEFPAPVVVVRHLHAGYPSMAAALLGRHVLLEVKETEAGDRLRPGTVYIAPPGRHLLVGPEGTLALGLVRATEDVAVEVSFA